MKTNTKRYLKCLIICSVYKWEADYGIFSPFGTPTALPDNVMSPDICVWACMVALAPDWFDLASCDDDLPFRSTPDPLLSLDDNRNSLLKPMTLAGL